MNLYLQHKPARVVDISFSKPKLEDPGVELLSETPQQRDQTPATLNEQTAFFKGLDQLYPRAVVLTTVFDKKKTEVTAKTQLPPIHVPEISHKDALYINKSPLTAPTAKQPIYTRHEGGIRVYPDDTDVNMVYVRIPATPNWVGASLNGQIVPNEADADYQNFELHPSEEPELIAKILAYSGVIIRAQDITQVGAAKEQQIIQDHG